MMILGRAEGGRFDEGPNGWANFDGASEQCLIRNFRMDFRHWLELFKIALFKISLMKILPILRFDSFAC